MLRVVGPPGSGKSLLITSLVEELRDRGHRIATVVRREDAIIVISLSIGSRVTLDRSAVVADMPSIVGAIDPAVDLVIAEGFDDPGTPAIEVRPRGARPHGVGGADLVMVVDAEELAAAFARSGPNDDLGIAARVEHVLFDGPAPEPPSRGRRGWLDRLRRR